MITSRRSLLTGLGASLIVAPAIVRAVSLMPVRGVVMPMGPPYFRIIDPSMFHDLMENINWRAVVEHTCDHLGLNKSEVLVPAEIGEIAGLRFIG